MSQFCTRGVAAVPDPVHFWACLLGASINRALGRDPQEQINPGSTTLIPTRANSSDDRLPRIPGRTIVLEQTADDDLKILRFTLLPATVVVWLSRRQLSRVKFPRKRKTSPKESTTAKRNAHVYGLSGVYAHDTQANEDVRFKYEEDELVSTFSPVIKEQTAQWEPILAVGR